jgi:hypothetical protein
MICIKESVLRARLDGELGGEELEAVEQHLGVCKGCQTRAETMLRQSQEVYRLLESLSPSSAGSSPDAKGALSQLMAERSLDPEAGRSRWWWLITPSWRPVWGAVSAALVVIVIFSFAPARSWAQRILSMFRVQKVSVVSIDSEALNAENQNGRTAELISKLLSDQVTFTHKAAKPVPAANAAAATGLAGFPVRLPRALSIPPKLMVGGSQAFQMKLDRRRLQSILDEAGRSDLKLPPSMDGAMIGVQVQPVVFAAYGNCPSRGASRNASPQVETPGVPSTGCEVFVQAPSPAVSVPPNLNIAELAEIALQFAGMSRQQAHDFCKTVDWTSTLVIPVPSRAAGYQTVPVDGVDGTLIQTYALRHSQMGNYTLLWVKNGIIYSLSGAKDPEQAMVFGDSLD